MKKKLSNLFLFTAFAVTVIITIGEVIFFCYELFFDSCCKDFSESVRFANDLRSYRTMADKSVGEKQHEARCEGVRLLLSKRQEMTSFYWFAYIAVRSRLVDFQTLQEIDSSLAERIRTDYIRSLSYGLCDIRREGKTVLLIGQNWLKVAAQTVRAEILCWEDIGLSPDEVEICQRLYGGKAS